MAAFPTVKIEEIEIPRVLIGINSLLGWSHTSAGRDQWIRSPVTVDRNLSNSIKTHQEMVSRAQRLRRRKEKRTVTRDRKTPI